jgi:hypothetical protein
LQGTRDITRSTAHVMSLLERVITWPEKLLTAAKSLGRSWWPGHRGPVAQVREDAAAEEDWSSGRRVGPSTLRSGQ